MLRNISEKYIIDNYPNLSNSFDPFEDEVEEEITEPNWKEVLKGTDYEDLWWFFPMFWNLSILSKSKYKSNTELINKFKLFYDFINREGDDVKQYLFYIHSITYNH